MPSGCGLMWRIASVISQPTMKPFWKYLMDTGLKTQLWMGISEAYFEGLSEDESMAKAVAMVSYLSDRAESLGCKVGLYNHGGWFGEPNKPGETHQSHAR
jgi:hypothetical protein